MFSFYGRIVNVRLFAAMRRAIVSFAVKSDAVAAMKALDKKPVQGSVITIKFASPKAEV